MAKEIHPISGEKITGRYVEGLKPGDWISYHHNGTLMSKITYLDGKEYGDEIPIIMTCQTG
jgi:antitoxin component YwqK of YwqJK toxin-antitoxin module